MTVKQDAVEKPAAMNNPRTWLNTAQDPLTVYDNEDSRMYMVIEELTISL